jgi:cytochrome c553
MANDLGQTIATHGNGKGAIACMACHGSKGEGQAQTGFPRLAGLDAGYIEKQLHDFTTAQRNNVMMSATAKALSDTEIKAIANYYAKLTLVASATQLSTNEALIQTGKTLAERGNWSNDIPACFACHGEGGNGIGSAFPALAGQHANYIEKQLNDWRSGLRSNDPNELMKGVALRLSDAEINAVSTFFASLNKAGN